MNSVGAITRGWCPGTLRPMESGDGLIVRLRVTGGIVDVALAQRIARWSQLWGNGRIELSNRANLQLRGISPAHLPDLLAALSQSGLLDSSAAGEAVRNVVSSPMAGLDPRAVLDIMPIAKALEHRLSDDASLHALPGKFGFAIDDGGLFGLDDIAADIGFVARRTADGPGFDIRLGGAVQDRFGPCRPDAVPDATAALAKAFLRAGRDVGARRMRDLVAAVGAEAVAQVAGLERIGAARAGRAVSLSDLLGVQPLGAGAFVGVGLPFGAVQADAFARLAATAAAHDAAELRLTPWRAILVPVPSITAARRIAAELAGCDFIPTARCDDGLCVDTVMAAARPPSTTFRCSPREIRGWWDHVPDLEPGIAHHDGERSSRRAAGIILDPRDPRLRIAACPGAPACSRGTTLARNDAATLVADVAPGTGVVVHVSGCEKGCAHPREAAITLVGREGLYDVVRDGTASDPPVARCLTLEQARAHIRGLAA